jgi:hypothetical protein
VRQHGVDGAEVDGGAAIVPVARPLAAEVPGYGEFLRVVMAATVIIGIGAAAEEFGERLLADVNVEPPAIGTVEVARGVAGVVLRHDGRVGLLALGDATVGRVVEEVVAPGDLGERPAPSGSELQHAVEASDGVENLIHTHGSSVNLKCLWRVWC